MLHARSPVPFHSTLPARRARGIAARAALGALALAATAATAAPAAATTVLITEVVDGPLGPGQPAFVELTIINDFDLDMSNYSIGVFQDGSALLAGGQSTVLSGTVLGYGQYIVAFEDGDAPGTGTFRTVYGADPDHFGFGAILDGDDAIALYLSNGSGPGGAATGDGSDATLIDVYGVIGVDGTGQPWEYSAGFAVRCAPEPSPVFTPWEWTFSGPGALEAGCGGDEACETQNLLQLTDPFGYECTTGQLVGDLCFGDGSGAPCGCGNEAPPGIRTGCLNGLGLGARLFATGAPSVSNDTLVLRAGGVPAQPGLFFQGNSLIGGGSGVTFGDGIRCTGQGVVRVQIVVGQHPEPTTVHTSVSVSAQGPPGTIMPGIFKYYQYWYRDPAGSPCGTNFNLSNATQVLWL